MRRLAFSLTEVLVVMAIIVILSALILPAFTRARDSAKAAVCVSNLAQIYKAIQVYKGDYDDQFYGGQPISPRFKPYLSNTILHCPVAQYKFTLGNDYTIVVVPPNTPAYAKYLECKAIRIGDLPLAVDTNHATSEQRIKNGTSFILLVRDNGSVKRVEDRTRQFLQGAEKPPCAPELGWLNF